MYDPLFRRVLWFIQEKLMDTALLFLVLAIWVFAKIFQKEVNN